MGDASARAVWAMVREQFRLAERTAAMTAQVLVPRTQKSRPEAAEESLMNFEKQSSNKQLENEL